MATVVRGDHPGAAVAADVRLACLIENRAELAGKFALVPGDSPGGARHSPQVAAVRPAEHHPEIHPGHVALAAAAVLRTRILGATVGALLVILDNGDPAEASVEAGADVDVSSRAVAAAQKEAAASRPFFTGDGAIGAQGVARDEGAVRRCVPCRVWDTGDRETL